ncbi:hypothetical protein JCM11957_14460 [Caminibacter profundus]
MFKTAIISILFIIFHCPFSIVNWYNNKFVLESKINEFTHDFIKLGNALKERIEFEEERLYILY